MQDHITTLREQLTEAEARVSRAEARADQAGADLRAEREAAAQERARLLALIETQVRTRTWWRRLLRRG